MSEPLARLMFPGRSALGETIQLSGEGLYTVIGVAANVRALAANTSGLPHVYACAGLEQAPLWGTIAIRARDHIDPAVLVPLLREAVHAVDPLQPLTDIKTVREMVGEAVTSRWFEGALITSFAALAVVLSVFGLYALVAYVVAQRTQEFGVRIALGAQRSDVIRLVLGEGGALIAAELILGVAAALPLVRFLKSLLFEVEPLDATAFAGTATLLALVAIAAACLPALRASRVDPVTAIRVE
jgi:predicted lysophospholipase L1 biosynthesis ABC-type transport system permease subunit